MMVTNYIVLTHTNPKQVKRLIARLQTPTSFFYVHVDRNANIKNFISELAGFGNLFYLPDEYRYAGTWGDLGIVKATIAALQQIIADGRSGYCILISGQDYPLKSNQQIESFFEKNYGTNFITAFHFPPVWKERINYYKINKSAKRGDFATLPSFFEKELYTAKIKKVIRLLSAGKFSFLFKLLQKRKFPAYMEPYAGDQWWALPVETAKKIIAFIDKHPDYLEYHKYSLLPDEMFFQSIFMSLNKNKELGVHHPSITYVKWTPINELFPNSLTPVIFTRHHLSELISLPEDKLFARKFDSKADSEIFDLLDVEN